MKRSLGLIFSFFVIMGSIHGHNQEKIAALRVAQGEAEKSLLGYVAACKAAYYAEHVMMGAWDILVARGGAWECYNNTYAQLLMDRIAVPADIAAKNVQLRTILIDTKAIEVRYRAVRRLARKATS